MKKEYMQKLESMTQLRIVGKIKTSNDKHKMICMLCGNKLYVTPKSKLANYKKHKLTGCPECTHKKKYEQTKVDNVERLKNLGYILFEEYIGLKEKILIQNSNCSCGRTWKTTPEHIFSGRSFCKPCNDDKKRIRLDEYNKDKHLTALLNKSGFEKYTFKVRSLTEQIYIENINIINPFNYPRGRSGTKNAYHLDHKISIKYCFINNIPEDICAHVDNLQMLPWKDNSVKYQKQTEIIPKIFWKYLNAYDDKVAKMDKILKEMKCGMINKIINNIKVDIYFENENTGIMFHRNIDIVEGLVGKKYLEKMNELIGDCRLIHFFEHEWVDKFDIVYSKISHILHSNLATTIYARKCMVKEISTKDKRDILNNNHIQGNDSSQIALGAYHNDTLVAVMTFCKPRVFMNHNKVKEDVWELSRFVTESNYRVIGIASKLLKHFLRNYTWDEIYSFADLRFTTLDSSVYNTLDFTSTKSPTLNYYYLVDDKLEYRWKYRKDNIKKLYPDQYNPKLTEYQNMLNIGYDRVWNCGIMKYEMQNI